MAILCSLGVIGGVVDVYVCGVKLHHVGSLYIYYVHVTSLLNLYVSTKPHGVTFHRTIILQRVIVKKSIFQLVPVF